MADFVAVLKKTLDGLSDTSPQMREKVYEKARLTIASKLGAMNPPPPAAVADRQKRALDDAIAQVERDYAPKPPASDPLAELDDVFASLKSPTISREPPRPPRPEPPRQEPPKVERAPVEKAPLDKAQPVGRPVVDKPPVAEKPVQVQRPPAPPVAAIPEPAAAPFESPAQPEQTRHIPHGEAVDALFADVPEDEDYEQDVPTRPPVRSRPRRRRGMLRLLVAAVVVGALAATAYGVWVNRDMVDGRVQDLLARFGLTGETPVSAPVDTVEAEPPADGTEADTAGSATPEPAEEVDVAAAAPETGQPAVEKFTQRLNSDGTETDAGPAGGVPVLGEGTSIATISEPPLASMDAAAPEPLSDVAAAEPAPEANPQDAPGDVAEVPPEAEPAAEPATDDAPDAQTAQAEAEPSAATPEAAVDEAPAADGTPAVDEAPAAEAAAQPATDAPAAAAVDGSAIPVAQRAIFYEERTNVADASAEPGSTVWSIVQESPGDNLPAEPAIRAETSIPGKEVQLRMTIRRNADKSLPASHIIEMIFITPDGFEGGAIDNVLRVSLKGSEQEAGSPLLGIPAKIADGFFLIALNDTKPEIDANMSLLGRQAWIDIPIQYKNGRRALFTMEKGIPGTKAFEEALKAWQAASG